MIGLAIWLGVLLLSALVWFLLRKGGYKRKPLDVPPGPERVRTEERVVDPSTGDSLEVWFHPSSGERGYPRGRSSVT